MQITRKKIKTKRATPSSSYFFFLVIAFMIFIIIQMHTITSPNSMMNAAPPTDTTAIVTNAKSNTIIAKTINNTICSLPPSFIKEDEKIAKDKRRSR